MTALPYDDGSDRIPEGITRPVERVVVVGAGIAGLAAANALANAGVPVVVLEGRDRIGGRLHTADVGGSPIDLGGSWIHSPLGNPLTAWAEQLGVERRLADLYDGNTGVALGAGRLADERFRPLLELAFEHFGEVLEGLAADLPPDAPVVTAIDRFVAAQRASGLDPADAPLLRTLVLDAVESGASGPADDISLAGYPTNGLFYEGSDFGDFPLGGYRRLYEPLARGLDVRLGRVVTTVTLRDGAVAVAVADGEVFEATHALVTVPLGVLKAEAIRFDPPLPDDRRAAINRLGFGQLEKVALRFEHPFWTEAGAPHITALPADGTQVPVIIMGLDRIVDEPAVIAFAFGSRVGILADVPAEVAVARVLAVMAAAVGGQVPRPTAWARTSWGADPFSRGAYAYLRPGSSHDDLDELGRPLGGRLLFAGEATGSARVGFADGAFSTGIREAKRLLGQPRVLLGTR